MLVKKHRSLFIVKLFIAVLTLGFFVPSVAATSNQPFKDVPSNHPYFEAISDLKDQDVISGYSDGEFKLGASITRAEASTIFVNLLNLSSDGVKLPFTDIKQDAWYTNNIAALYGAGIINGYEDNTFKPNAPITRAEFSKMIVEAFDLFMMYDEILPFTDLKPNAWYIPTIEILYVNGLINGVTETLFMPGNMIKRGDATWLIYNVTLLNEHNETVYATIDKIAADFDKLNLAPAVWISDNYYSDIQIEGRFDSSGEDIYYGDYTDMDKLIHDLYEIVKYLDDQEYDYYVSTFNHQFIIDVTLPKKNSVDLDNTVLGKTVKKIQNDFNSLGLIPSIWIPEGESFDLIISGVLDWKGFNKGAYVDGDKYVSDYNEIKTYLDVNGYKYRSSSGGHSFSFEITL